MLADIILEAWSRVKREENGFYCESPDDILSDLITCEDIYKTEYPYGENSPDPSYKILFFDGSAVSISNPRQYAFPGSIDKSNFFDVNHIRRKVEDFLRKSSDKCILETADFLSKFYSFKN